MRSGKKKCVKINAFLLADLIFATKPVNKDNNTATTTITATTTTTTTTITATTTTSVAPAEQASETELKKKTINSSAGKISEIEKKGI